MLAAKDNAAVAMYHQSEQYTYLEEQICFHMWVIKVVFVNPVRDSFG